MPDGRPKTPCPRQYPAAFCAELVKISEDLKASRRGCAQAPGFVCPSPEELLSLATVPCDDYLFADLPNVYRYVRGGHTLRIPELWRAVIPRSLDES